MSRPLDAERISHFAIEALSYWVNVNRKPHVRIAQVVRGYPTDRYSDKPVYPLLYITFEQLGANKQSVVQTYIGDAKNDMLHFNKKWPHGVTLMEGGLGEDTPIYFLLTPLDDKTVRVELSNFHAQAQTRWTRLDCFSHSAAQPELGLSANSQ